MPECPYCGEWFRSNKGLKQHITKVHTMDTPLGKTINPLSIDPFMKKRAEREKKRKGLLW